MRRPHLPQLLRSHRRTRLGASFALLVVIAVVVALVAGVFGTSSPKASANSSTASGATAVERRNLVETDTESGTVGYANARTVYNHLSGTLTWLPGVGQEIKPGQTLFKVDGKPVILMDGSTPAYRNLSSSDSAGQDILELNRNLVDLGFNPDGIVVDDTWQSATTAGVDAFQKSLGETQTGSLTLGDVVFLPGDQLISTVQGTLGSSVSDPAPSHGPEFVDLHTGSPGSSHNNPGGNNNPGNNRHHGKNKLANLEALIALLKAEIAEMKANNGNGGNSPNSGNGGNSPNSGNGGNSPNSGNGGNSPNSGNGGNSPNSGNGGNSPNSGNGGGGGGGTPVLQTTSTHLVVTVDLSASKQSEAKVGEPVTVEMPAGNTVNGKITSVSPVASNSGGNNGNGNSGNSSGSTIPVKIALSGHQSGAGLDQASVSVNFAQAKANHVLSVPVTALLATGGGNYAVQEAAAPHKLIPVTTGLFAAGYVQISGAGVYPGLQVTDSQG